MEFVFAVPDVGGSVSRSATQAVEADPMTDEQLTRAASAWCDNCNTVESVRYEPMMTMSAHVKPFDVVCQKCAWVIATLYFDTVPTQADDPTQSLSIDT